MPDPRFSVAEITTIHQTYEQDLATYKQAGAEGIGLWEFKLPAGQDRESVARLKDSGLRATTCIPAVVSVWPIPFPGPDNPDERIEALCEAIRRFAVFEPEIVLCVTGRPPDRVLDEARHVVVEGLRKVANVAASHGITIGLEPLHRTFYRDWTIVGTIPETVDLIDEIGEPNVGVLFDVYHLWDVKTLLADISAYGARILPSVHICDWRHPPRNDFDRVLPGQGDADLPGILGALESAGVVGWFELEIFSDDGQFTDFALPDSLWRENPLDVVVRGKTGFEHAWETRRAPDLAPPADRTMTRRRNE